MVEKKEDLKIINVFYGKMRHPLMLYNTFTRKKEVFKPLKDNLVRIYTCGPTVYSYAHLGNFRTFLFEDFLKRVLLYNGLKVLHVMNITDVGHLTSDADEGEDKIEKAAKEKGMNAWEIAKFYTKAFMRDVERLNIIPADIYPKATEHIDDMIKFIKLIEKNGYTYEIPGEGIYFDTSKLSDYGELARLKIDKLKAGARISAEGKRNPTDFALWKYSPKDKKRQMEWQSPWGIGFPGWHIECSVMSTKYLGNYFDIHCGGIDHIPVHHTNEIAQCEAALGTKQARFWLHSEFLVFKEGKMSKSTGGIITVQDLIDKGYDPLAYRYLCLTGHYRKPLIFSWDAINAAQNALNKLRNRVLELMDSSDDSGDKELYRERFIKAINDDLDMPKALAVMWDMLKSDLGDKAKYELLMDFDKVFGLKLNEVKKESIPNEVLRLVEEREQLRKEKNFSEADKIRDKLREMGYHVDDTPKGPRIRKI